MALRSFTAFAALLLAPGVAQDTIANTANADGRFGTLVTALRTANLVSTFNTTGANYTVFAPTDAAFAVLLQSLNITAAQLLARSDLGDILRYHVLASTVLSTQLQARQNPVTLQGRWLPITKDTNGVKVGLNTANVTSADIRCSNGVIHVIDKVLLPPATIADTAAANGNFGTLVQALTTASLVNTFQAAGPYTVFAPTDAAFSALLQALNVTAAQLLARSDLGDILRYHVLASAVLSTQLQAKQNPVTLQGRWLPVTKDTNGVKVGLNTAAVTAADIQCSNGVIHVIDKVLLPPTTIADTAAANGNFGTLVQALTTASLVNTFQAAGAYTVFAPTDAAFASLLQSLSLTATQLLARSDLGAILRYHVLSGKTLSSQLSASQSVATLQGSSVTITKGAGGVRVGNATVTTADLECSNGVIHVIDAVLLPPATTTTATTTRSTQVSGAPVVGHWAPLASVLLFLGVAAGL